MIDTQYSHPFRQARENDKIKGSKKYAIGKVINTNETLSCPNAFKVKASTVNRINDTINQINENFKEIIFCVIKKPSKSNGNNKNTALNIALNLSPIRNAFCINASSHWL